MGEKGLCALCELFYNAYWLYGTFIPLILYYPTHKKGTYSLLFF